MKYDFKISTLSIVCVLCAAVSGAAFAAPAVRSLGGAGTYVGSTGATAAKSGTTTTPATTSSVRAVRGGSMRVNPVTSGAAASSTRASATRASSTPRLSIGKYLSGVGATGKPVASTGGSSSGSMGVGQAGVEQRVTKLEKALGLDEYDGNFGSLVIDVEQMQKDIAALTGEMPLIEFEDGTFREFFPEDCAMLTSLSWKDLYRQMKDCLEEPVRLQLYDANATDYLSTLSWEKSGQQFYEILSQIQEQTESL